MKYLVKLFVVTFLISICTNLYAEEKITYIDLKYVLNFSKAGKGAQEFLKKTFNDNQKKFMAIEKKLKSEEEKLISQKNSLSKEDYKKESDELRKKVNKYQSDRRVSIDDIARKRAEAKKQLISVLDPILKSYVDENGISLILDKKIVIAGKTNLDITGLIVEKLNKKIPSLNIK